MTRAALDVDGEVNVEFRTCFMTNVADPMIQAVRSHFSLNECASAWSWYLFACLATLLFASGCDDTATSSRGVPADGADAPLVDPEDVPGIDARLDARLDARFDAAAVDTAVADARVVVDATVDVVGDLSVVPLPDAATCGLAADVPIVLVPDVEVPLDVYESCRTVLPDADAGAPCVPAAVEACTCVDGLSGTRTCRDDMYWASCRCRVADAGADASLGSDGPIPQITVPRLIAPQSGARATSQRPTFRWVLPVDVTRARVEVCADRPCARMLMQQEVTGTSWRPDATLPPGVAFWRVRGLAPSGTVTWTSATWEVGIRHRDLPVDISYGVLQDFNGDGYDDAVILSDFSRHTYVQRIYTGGSSGLQADRYRGMNPPFPGMISADDAAGFGEVVASGDVNGDGLADLVVGTSYFSPAPTGEHEGRIFIYPGARDSILPACMQTLVPPLLGRVYDYGYDVSVGDFDGDGYGDVVVTAGSLEDGVHLHRGGPSGTEYIPIDSISGVESNAKFVGDVNGDGYADIAARTGSSPDESGVAILYGNPLSRLSFHVQGPFYAIPRYDEFGRLMEWGDFNADGYSDVVLAGRNYVYVYHGSPEGLTLATRLVTPPLTSGEVTIEGVPFGGHVSAPGDIDGDGRLEVAIGAQFAPLGHGGRGMAFIYSSTGSRIPSLWNQVLAPVTPVVDFGVVAIPGDLNGDGFDDLLVGAPSGSASGLSCEVYVYHGRPGEWWCAPSLIIRGHEPTVLGHLIH